MYTLLSCRSGIDKGMSLLTTAIYECDSNHQKFTAECEQWRAGQIVLNSPLKNGVVLKLDTIQTKKRNTTVKTFAGVADCDLRR